MSKELINSIVNSVSFIPGIVGLSKIDLNKKRDALLEKDWPKSVLISESDKGFDVSIAFIVSREINSKTISKEVHSSISSIFENQAIQLNKINIYIRGVK